MSKVITALDYATSSEALKVASTIDPSLSRVKVGKELFTRAGPQVVSDLHAMGFEVFLDLKFHDIPNTVAGAVRAASELGVWMVNVHASGGERMMAAARDAVTQTGSETLLIAVTVLTSMDDAELASVGISTTASQQVVSLATLTAKAGLDGVVCSPHEVPEIKQAVSSQAVSSLNAKFLTVTPGVRPTALNGADDQRRTMTPVDAIRNGSDYLVIGRPITQAENPNSTLTQIIEDTAVAV